MDAYLVRVEAKPGSKIQFDPPGTVRGYYQRLGVTARNNRDLIEIVRAYVSEDTGGEVLELDDSSVPDFEGTDSDIRDECDGIETRGIWYISGRAFYGDE